jgi:hypothetical protein
MLQAQSIGMNTKQITLAVGLSTFTALTALAGPPIVVVSPPVITVPAPVIVVPTPVITVPAPAVTVVSTVPDNYVWDGTEFVGVVGTQYYYLGSNKAWLPVDPVRFGRFNDWQRVHTDWRTHAIRNDLYRHDAHGHTVPLRVDHAHDVGHDAHDAGHDDVNHDHDHDH